jgi:hypothetical protein
MCAVAIFAAQNECLCNHGVTEFTPVKRRVQQISVGDADQIRTCSSSV